MYLKIHTMNARVSQSVIQKASQDKQISAVADESTWCTAWRQTCCKQCDKLATELSWHHLPRSTFSSCSRWFI